MKDAHDKECLGECYFCGENNGRWCKLCQEVLCEKDHELHIDSINNYSDYLDAHTYYDREFLGVITA